MLIVTACSITPAKYSVSDENVHIMTAYQGSKARVVSLRLTAQFDSMCRLIGPIKPAYDLSIPQFIENAFNDELNQAGIYSDSGVKITGEVNMLKFSSSVNLSAGYWFIGIRLHSSNGNSLSISTKYDFKTSFIAYSACNITSAALSPAVQGLIRAAITHPDFGKLLI